MTVKGLFWQYIYILQYINIIYMFLEGFNQCVSTKIKQRSKYRGGIK